MKLATAGLDGEDAVTSPPEDDFEGHLEDDLDADFHDRHAEYSYDDDDKYVNVYVYLTHTNELKDAAA